jgi:two-component system OmpR family sensor kinase/two-component system sensor histidine kinase BaeS
MPTPPDPLAVKTIRRHLFLLLARALVVVVLVAFLFTLLFFTIASSSGAAGYKLLFLIPQLQSYYIAQGSWQGVDEAAQDFAYLAIPLSFQRWWEGLLLLDQNDIVIIDQARPLSPRLGRPYTPAKTDRLVPILVNHLQVGTLVQQPHGAAAFFSFFLDYLLPLSLVALPAAVLTLLIGVMLLRRVVYPLADVIVAARSVASGDLSARVEVRGPSDLRGLSDSFNRMAESLQQNEQQRRALFADIAHELRTPLTVIRGRLEGILDGIYPADELHVAPVLEETYLLERLVDDLRLLALAENRQLRLDLQPVDLGELARQAVALFEAQALEKSITLQLSLAPSLPAVSADPQRLSQVIGNLLSNALRYTPSGGAVRLAVRPQGDRVEVSLSDSGPGVPPEDLPHIFDRFWRAEKSRARHTGGAGLGLAIARHLIEAHGGRIWAENIPEGGLQVSFIV